MDIQISIHRKILHSQVYASQIIFSSRLCLVIKLYNSYYNLGILRDAFVLQDRNMASFIWLNSAFGFQQYHSPYKSRDYILNEKQAKRRSYRLFR